MQFLGDNLLINLDDVKYFIRKNNCIQIVAKAIFPYYFEVTVINNIINDLIKLDYIVCGDYVLKCDYIAKINDKYIIYPSKHVLPDDFQYAGTDLIKLGDFYIRESSISMVYTDHMIHVITIHGNFTIPVKENDCIVCAYKKFNIKTLSETTYKCDFILAVKTPENITISYENNKMFINQFSDIIISIGVEKKVFNSIVKQFLSK